MTSPKPLLPCPERLEYEVPEDNGRIINYAHPAYADWLLDVATRAMEYAHHENDCWKKADFQAQNCTCGLKELRAALDKAR